MGDTIAYTYLVTNTGNVTLASVAVDDPTLGAVTCPTPPAPAWPRAPRRPAPPTGPTPSPRPTSTPAASSTPPPPPAPTLAGLTSPDSAPSTVTTLTAPAAPAVSVLKLRDRLPTSRSDRRPESATAIIYTFEVTNTGNVTLAAVSVSDPTGGAVRCPTLAEPGLAPGRTVTCTGDSPRLVSPADLAAGKAVDTATATGTDRRGSVSPPSAPSTATIPVVASPANQPGPTPPSRSAPTPPAASGNPPTSDPAPAQSAAGTAADPPGQDADPSPDLKAATADPPGQDADPSPDLKAATADPPGQDADPSPDLKAATADPPSELGSIATDLGRWRPGDHGPAELAGGVALFVAGGVILILRRSRPRPEAALTTHDHDL